MTDREFIKAELQKLQKILETGADMCIGNDNWNKATNLLSFATACSGAIDLLKEQEAVKPIYNEEKYGDHLPHCGNCEKVLSNNAVYGKVNFCHYCGKAVK